MSPFSSRRTCLSILTATLLAAAAGACGARSEVLSSGDPDGPGGGDPGGAGGSAGNTASTGGTGGAPCGPSGASCVFDSDCCALPCIQGTCAEPPPPCASDEGPVVLKSGLSLPITMVGDATSLFVGENTPDGEILRVPKTGDASQVLASGLSTEQSIAVDDNTVFYMSGGELRAIPAAGGAEPALVYNAFGSAGITLTKDVIFLTSVLGELVRIDRATLDATVLVSGLSNPELIAVLQGLVFISSGQAGLYRYDLAAGTLDLLASELGSPRALLAFHDDVYFTVPSRIYRLQPTAKSPLLLADLGMLGVHPESLVTDGKHLYTTLVMNGGGGPGIVVRVPLAGGEPEVIVADAGIYPRGLVVDQACVYWIEWQGGAVRRARKDPGPP